MSNQYETPTPEQLLQWRKTNGLSQTGAAEVARVTRRTYQNWEWGKFQCPAPVWELIRIKSGAIRVPKLSGGNS